MKEDASMGCGSSSASFSDASEMHHRKYESSGGVFPDSSIFHEESVAMNSDLLGGCELSVKDVYKLKQSWRAVRRNMDSTGTEMLVR